MYELIGFFSDLFKMIFQVSIIAGTLVLLILMLRKLFKGKLGVKFQYALWFIVVLRLIMPTLPRSSFSIFNLMTRIRELPYLLFAMGKNEVGSIVAYSTDTLSYIYNQGAVLGNLTSPNLSSSNPASFNWSFVATLAFIWLLGIFIISLYIVLVNIKLRSRIKKQPKFCNKEVISMLEQCKQQMKIDKHISLIETGEIRTPALFGYIEPVILLPENTLDVLSVDKLRYVFLHELSHLKRKDIITNWIISILKIIHWFNPIVQYGLKKMCEDMEICCDSLALSYTKDEEVKEYGFTIISLIERLSKPAQVPGTAPMVNNKSEVKRRIIMIKLFNKKTYKFSAFALAALLILGCTALTDAKESAFKKSKAVHVDKIDYPFVKDPQLIGRWQSLDLVPNIEDFKVDTKFFKDNLYVKELNFTGEGKVSKTVFTWTKDHILNPVDKTDSKYLIKDINGSTYMFFEWKNGDYTLRGIKPRYYVLKKISSTPSLTTNMFGEEVKTRTDKIDYPFVNDSQVIGKWESVDFVQKIENFKPGLQNWKGEDLFIANLTFNEKGDLVMEGSTINESGKTASIRLFWTQGLIINKEVKTASKYIIKDIKGERYMFFEWKNGDYIERGATPCYYVLKQVK
ncbi:M56 family metallopeptidase [Clostridium aciditolerans]|uniref:M56 family metallopeptidase n=2 Tax=Clostridium aciditolerans TaxID=339861 RepID=A0A934I1S6_9CLOT|nr:M56 family metallopeptidase [Clostridium aciditolerans]